MENLLAEFLLGMFLSPFRAIMLLSGLIAMSAPVIFLVEQARERSGRRRWGRIVVGDFIPARATFQAYVIVAAVGFIGIAYALIGTSSFRESFAQVLFWPVIVIGVVWVWGWVEKEFAWPGWFVAIEVKDVPGEFLARRERRRREREDLIQLGREVLRRQAAEGGSAVLDGVASAESDLDREPNAGPLDGEPHVGNDVSDREGEAEGPAHRS